MDNPSPTTQNKNPRSSNCFSLDPKKSLEKQLSFWLTIAVPIVLFCIFGFFAWQDHTIDMSFIGFNRFITISQLPLGILALSLPLGMMVIRIHATKQTALQIDTAKDQIKNAEIQINNAKTQITQTKQQNLFINKLAHRKEFFEVLKALEKEHSIVFSKKIKIYHWLFPENLLDAYNFNALENADDYPLNSTLTRYTQKIRFYNQKFKDSSQHLMDHPETTQGDATMVQNLYDDVDSINVNLHFEIDTNSENKTEFTINKHPITLAYSPKRPLLHLEIINDVFENLFIFGNLEYNEPAKIATNNQGFKASLQQFLSKGTLVPFFDNKPTKNN